jgi:hypothetical protein
VSIISVLYSKTADVYEDIHVPQKEPTWSLVYDIARIIYKDIGQGLALDQMSAMVLFVQRQRL